MTKISCCKGCRLRYIGCHCSCLAYIDEKQKIDAVSNKINRQKDIDNMLNEFVAKRYRARRRK